MSSTQSTQNRVDLLWLILPFSFLFCYKTVFCRIESSSRHASLEKKTNYHEQLQPIWVQVYFTNVLEISNWAPHSIETEPFFGIKKKNVLVRLAPPELRWKWAGKRRFSSGAGHVRANTLRTLRANKYMPSVRSVRARVLNWSWCWLQIAHLPGGRDGKRC